MSGSRYTYVLCRRNEPTIQIDINDYRDPYDDVFLTYWVKTLQHLEASCTLEDLTFYIVWNNETIRELPSYGDKVVVLLLMDEFCEIPTYFGQVRFVFKTGGFYPYVNPSLRGKNLALIVKALRDVARWTYQCGALALKHGGAIRRGRGGMVMPLGYARQIDIPLIPFQARRYAVSFVGSVKQRAYRPFSVRAILGTPKDIARSRMIKALQQISEDGSINIFCSDTKSYMQGVRSDGVLYSEIMADTNICLAPRGSSPETFRLFEAMRHGCIVISDRVPKHWIYRDCPFLQVDDWTDLRSHVRALLADPTRMLELHRASLAWWERRCSERSLATVMAGALAQAG